jgi:SAM-dependent methyltransferase
VAAARGEWNHSAAGWERWEAVIMHSLAFANAPLLRALDLEPGHRVLDVGCGTGDPATAIAQWVGPGGEVVGVDVSDGMLAVARRRARLLRLPRLRFRRGDMDRLRMPGPPFDRAVSRFGLMFAKDPLETLRAIGRHLAPGGRLVAAVWSQNSPGAALREEAIRPFRSGPPPDPESAPDPRRFARPGTLERLFERAGFRDVHSETVAAYMLHASLDDLVAMLRDTSMQESFDTLRPVQRRRLAERLRRLFRRYADGPVVRVPSEARVVSGVWPGC